MRTELIRLLNLLGGASLCLSLGGCLIDFKPPESIPEIVPQTQARFSEARKVNVTTVTGFVWDPEAFWFTLASCGQTCPIPPIRIPGVPIFDRSLVNGTAVALFDPVTAQATLTAAKPTGTDGAFELLGVPSRPGPPFLAFATRTGPESTALTPAGPPTLTPVPAAAYLPTLTMKPIFTRTTNCIGQGAALVSDKGALEAVAKYLSQQGSATTVADLINPARFGGVAVLWAYRAAGPPVRVPAFGVKVTTSGGTLLPINWAPPGAPLPPPLLALQSHRGFFVDTSAPQAPLGLAVLLLPPLQGPPSPTQLAVVDPVNNAADGRPWAFPPLPPMVIAPGLISFIELPGLQPGSPPPPEWVCLN